MIALVVTIVVLLILSAVAIGLSVGDNGIITSARNATDQWEQGVANEQDELKQIANFINGNTSSGGEKTTVADVVGGDKFEQTETIEDDNGKEVTIPKGFGVAEDSNTVVDEGIVITDGTNEFVWVPVDDPSTMFIEGTAKLNGVGTTTNIYSKLKIRDEDTEIDTTGKPGESEKVREPDVLSNYDTDSSYYKTILDFDSTKEMADSIVAEYKAMSDSVKKYHGFYIGRYELTGTVDKPTEKAGKVLTASTAGNWYNLYKACQNVIKNNSDVKSTMIYGCQWDETCSWLEKNGYDINDSSDWGNYNSNRKETGSDPSYKANEIFDLAGNLFEWTQEACSSNYRIARGGVFRDSGSSFPVSDRRLSLPYNSDFINTSRAVLYIS